MDIILQIIMGLGIICTIFLIFLNIKYVDRKEEARRCPDCEQIPLKPDPRFTASRAACDEALLKIGTWERCSCGELKHKGYDSIK